ncbi:50S ribosomal protein L18 [Candidatus Uhrbacteria bacterium]|nr:50S ribosomal protein L18 [Candidatus Uhrbacteria bacterium]
MKPKNVIKQKRQQAALRARRVRARMRGTLAQPRLTVKRSLKHVYAQLVDDTAGRTLAAASDRDVVEKGTPVETARRVGSLLGTRAKEKGIAEVVFDRGSYRYHGRVAALAEGARESGLNF